MLGRLKVVMVGVVVVVNVIFDIVSSAVFCVSFGICRWKYLDAIRCLMLLMWEGRWRRWRR